MATLDLAFLLGDPLFTSGITVTRRPQVVDGTGTAQVGSSSQFTLTAVVTPASGSTLRLLPEALRTETYIEVFSQTPLNTGADGFFPDLVTWKGGSYVVTQVTDYTAFGAGFVRALCQAQAMVGPAI